MKENLLLRFLIKFLAFRVVFQIYFISMNLRRSCPCWGLKIFIVSKMYLTKLSKKYHLLSREQQLQQIREITFEDSEGESSSSVQEVWRRPQRLPPVAAAANGPSSASSSSASSNSVHRPGSAPSKNAHRPSTETVVIPSSTSSESSRSGQDNGDNNEDDSKDDHTYESMEDKDDSEDTYFNYGYSYDFEPEWLKNAKNRHTNSTKSE